MKIAQVKCVISLAYLNEVNQHYSPLQYERKINWSVKKTCFLIILTLLHMKLLYDRYKFIKQQLMEK
jgi:hypothetical protein